MVFHPSDGALVHAGKGQSKATDGGVGDSVTSGAGSSVGGIGSEKSAGVGLGGVSSGRATGTGGRGFIIWRGIGTGTGKDCATIC